MPTAEQLRAKAQKLLDDAAAVEDAEYVQSRIPEAVKLRTDEVARLQRQIDEQRMNAAERANFRAQLDAVQATIDQATDKYEAKRVELRLAIVNANTDAILGLQADVTAALFNVRALQQTADEIAAELNGVATDEDADAIDELVALRDGWTARTPLELAEALVEEEDRQTERRAAELARGAAAYMTHYKSPDLLAAEQRQRQEIFDKQLQATPWHDPYFGA
jgi:hypothetical protein